MMKKILFAVLALMLASGSVYAEKSDCSKLTNKTVYFYGETYLPVCEIADLCGFDVAWSREDLAFRLKKDDVEAIVPLNSAKVCINGKDVTFNNPTAFRNNVLYFPKSMAEKICEGFEFEIPAKNVDLSVGDKFRFGTAEKYSGWYVCGGKFWFKPYYISQNAAIEYADIVRLIADSLPNVRVFNMLVPEGSEIYAPKNLRCGQIEVFKTVVNMLPDNVTVVNACAALYEKANEKIYFDTDHHWTQRGAYYGYRAFLNATGGNIAPIASFESRDFYQYCGSYGNEGLNIAEYEIMERFMPTGENKGYIYDGSSALGNKHSIQIVNPDDNTYACFIGGDNGLTELCGNVKNGKKLCIAKESFGNAMAVWAVNNYETVYVVDIRRFEGKLSGLYSETYFDDLLIESYAESVGSRDLRSALKKIA